MRWSAAQIFVHGQHFGPHLLDCGGVLELPVFLFRNLARLVQRFLVQRFRGRESLDILHKFLNLLSSLLQHIVQIACGPRLRGWRKLVNARRQPAEISRATRRFGIVRALLRQIGVRSFGGRWHNQRA